jgi:hypothetical protein
MQLAIGRIDFLLTGVLSQENIHFTLTFRTGVFENMPFAQYRKLSDLGPTPDDFREFAHTEFSHSHPFVGIKSEIEEARWFDRAELNLMLARRQHPDGVSIM